MSISRPGIPGYEKFRAGLQQSFRLKLFLYISFAIIGTMLVFTPLFLYDQNRHLKEELMRNGRALSDLLAYNISLWVFSENTEMLRDPVRGVRNQANVVEVSVYTKDDRLLLRDAADAGTGPARGGVRSAQEIVPGPVRSGSSAVREDRDAFVFFSPVFMKSFGTIDDVMFDSSRKEVTGYVKVAMGKEALRQASNALMVKNFFMGVILVAITLLMARILLRRVTRPLNTLTDSVKLLGMGKDVKVPVESSDEIGALAQSFNTMTEDLKKRDEEKRLLEEKLRHAEKMQAVGTLARGVAHDFNNILATVRGSVYILEKKFVQDAPLRRYTDQMHNSIAKATDLVESLLVFSRMHTSYPVLLDLNVLVRQLAPTLGFIAGEGIDVKVFTCPEKLTIHANSVQVEQILINLARNARDAMPDGGRLSIRTEKASSDAVKGPAGGTAARYALITVSDTGTGMDAATQGRIFEPFFTTKEVGKGTGLGLAIVFGIVEEYKGSIEVHSEKGEGTTFSVFLPLAENTGMDGDAAFAAGELQ